MAIFWFKLRRNMTMDGDLQLARLELEALVGVVHDVTELPSGIFDSMTDYVRDGQQGYCADVDVMYLPILLRRLTFIQTMYVVTDDTPQLRGYLADCSACIAFSAREDQLYIEAIPHFALFEFVKVIARRARSISSMQKHLTWMLDGLLHQREDDKPKKFARRVLMAQQTSAPLSHGIHYYKAKFFPRMARSMLNITAGNRDLATLTVLDPFVGSGTTLLEASQLGLRNIGIDLDPLSVKISSAKLTILGHSYTQFASVVDEIRHNLTHPNRGVVLHPIEFPHWMMKNRKMSDNLAQELIAEIDRLRLAVCQVQVDDVVRNILWVILSDAITRRIKLRFLGIGVSRFSLTLSSYTLAHLFMRSLQTQLYNLIAWEWVRDKLSLQLAESQVQLGDARVLNNVPPVDLIVTSPPYLPASSGRETYAKARMPSLLALGIETHQGVEALADHAVGSMDGHWHESYQATDDVTQLVNWLQNDNLRQRKAQPTARYFADMRQSFRAMRERLADDGKLVLVSGRQSTFYRSKTREILYTVPVADMLVQEADIAGLQVDKLVHVPLKKLNRNARPRSLDDYDETLIFLSKR